MSRGNHVGICEIATLAVVVLAVWTEPTFAQSSSQPHPVDLKQTAIALPPMGWSSWNSFSNTINSDVTVQQTQTLVSSGMKKSGYSYVNIDEGWWMGKRDPQGNIIVDPKQWPALQPGEHDGDMVNIVRYIHRAGLKAGIYTDAGEDGCSFYGPDLGPPVPHTGSEHHYDQDFLQFAEWGFDYVKVDWCGGNHEKLDPATQYAEIAHSISRAEKITGHQLYYSICNWGSGKPWIWAPGIGGVHADIWRTSGDIVAPIVANTPNATRRASITGVLSNFDEGIHNQAQHTGFYNDLDMMMVGMPGLSESQNRVHMSLWAISGAPLIVGADLTKLDSPTKAILTNERVIAVDQDPLGIQAIKVGEPQPGLQIWVKPLTAPGDHAVLLLNRTSAEATIEVSWKQTGLSTPPSASVQDIWTGKKLKSSPSGYAALVPAGDATFLIVHGTEAPLTTYPSSASTTQQVPVDNDHAVSFSAAPIHGIAVVRISYKNRNDNSVIAEIRADGKAPTKVVFPTTGSEDYSGSIVIEMQSNQEGPSSTLSFSAADAVGLNVQSISVQEFREH